MLKDILEQKKCFKLVCGAGNENTDEVEKLVAIYAAAGCNLFDLSANKDVVEAAKKGLDFAIEKEKQSEYHFCISVGIKGDPHVRKAKIEHAKCIKCGECEKICPQKAITQSTVTTEYCIGCGRCEQICAKEAITYYETEKNLSEVLPELKEYGIDCIELHAIIENEDEVDTKWNQISTNFDGMLSICIDRQKLGNEKLLARIKRLIAKRPAYSTIIQADGAPMSGGEDDFKTTLQAVATAEIIQDAKMPAYLLLSGGTNSKTAELSTMCGITPNGIAIGSYARKIVKDFIQKEDFWQNELLFQEAVAKAKSLIEASIAPIQMQLMKNKKDIKKPKKKKEIRITGLNIDKAEFQQIVLSNSNFPDRKF